jgi:hypothetical protein
MQNSIAFRQFKNEMVFSRLRVSIRNIIHKNLLTVFLLISVPAGAQVNFSYQSPFKWLKGSDAVSLPGTWKNPGFDDSGWLSGNAPFRYGDGTGGTELTDMAPDGYSTIYLRSTFECTNKDLIAALKITADYDDGFILYINGTEALRCNAPASPFYNSLAPVTHESGFGEEYTIASQPFNLINGTNVIAVQGFNNTLASTDFYFDLTITGEVNLPVYDDTTGVSYSVPSGFYTDPFSVIVTSPYPSAKIVYTLDGSNPQSSLTSFISDSPVSVVIDPESTSGRGLTPGVVIRASVTDSGYKPARSVSATYIFIDKVKTQGMPGGGWPSGNVNGQIIDLPMDSKIVNDPAYADLIDDALLDIPSISVITGPENLFDPASGIYVNAEGHGINWEKECSVELIQPDGSAGFNVNAGLRIRGGWSRHDEYPKHAFRLFFREKYGNDKLYFPLFGDEGAAEFDKIDLRCEQNYSWQNWSPENSFVREIFSRDTQRDMGQPYTRSRYFHLYIDGMYWGLYQTQERSEARYAATYFGGNDEDYDVVKVNMENYAYTIEATDGNLSSWQRLWNLCATGFTSNANYFKIEGRDKDGLPVKGSEVLVDIDNLIDYMLIIFYTGNFDAPTSSFGNNKGCNNFYAIDDRTDKSTGFKFFAHDAEHSLFDEAHWPGIGIDEDRVNLATRTDAMKMEVTDLSRFHPQWLHYKLSANAEYRMRFADRAYSAFKTGGVFSSEKSLSRLNKRIDEVELAVIAESARWGDSKTVSYAYNKKDNWLPEIYKIRNRFIPYRSNKVITQLKTAGLYTTTRPPEFSTSSGKITVSDFVLDAPAEVRINNQNMAGVIYYTFDGTDPRNTGGSISNKAKSSHDDFSLTISKSTLLKARILYNGEWSSLEQVNFMKSDEDLSKLKITELNYHPSDLIAGSDTTEGKDLEFIEFKNTGKNSINLTGLRLDSAVYYSFPENELLPPGKFFVIASKPSVFYEFYGMNASGNYKGNLSNAGDEILMVDAGNNEVIHFSYYDSAPWPSKPDGDGFSLSAAEINPLRDPSDYIYWTTSYKTGGTPFADNSLTIPGQPDTNPDNYLLAFPNPTTGYLTLHYLSENEIEKIDLQVFDINGKIMYTAALSNPGSIDLSAKKLPAGIYFIKTAGSSFKSATRIVLLKQ